QAATMAMGAFLGAACGLFAALTVARPYLSAQSSALHVFGLAAIGFGVATVLAAPLVIPSVRNAARRLLMGRARIPGLQFSGLRFLSFRGGRLPSLAVVLQWLLLAAPVVILAGLAARPYLQVTRGFTDPYVIRYVDALQRLTGLTPDGRRQYYELSLNWVVW